MQLDSDRAAEIAIQLDRGQDGSTLDLAAPEVGSLCFINFAMTLFTSPTIITFCFIYMYLLCMYIYIYIDCQMYANIHIWDTHFDWLGLKLPRSWSPASALGFSAWCETMEKSRVPKAEQVRIFIRGCKGCEMVYCNDAAYQRLQCLTMEYHRNHGEPCISCCRSMVKKRGDECWKAESYYADLGVRISATWEMFPSPCFSFR